MRPIKMHQQVLQSARRLHRDRRLIQREHRLDAPRRRRPVHPARRAPDRRAWATWASWATRARSCTPSWAPTSRPSPSTCSCAVGPASRGMGEAARLMGMARGQRGLRRQRRRRVRRAQGDPPPRRRRPGEGVALHGARQLRRGGDGRSGSLSFRHTRTYVVFLAVFLAAAIVYGAACRSGSRLLRYRKIRPADPRRRPAAPSAEAGHPHHGQAWCCWSPSWLTCLVFAPLNVSPRSLALLATVLHGAARVRSTTSSPLRTAARSA